MQGNKRSANRYGTMCSMFICGRYVYSSGLYELHTCIPVVGAMHMNGVSAYSKAPQPHAGHEP